MQNAAHLVGPSLGGGRAGCSFPVRAEIGIHSDKRQVGTVLKVGVHVLPRRTAQQAGLGCSSYIVVEDGNWVDFMFSLGERANPVRAQIPRTEFQVVAEVVFLESTVCLLRVITKEIGVVPIGAEYGNFGLELDSHHDVLRIGLAQMLDEGTKGFQLTRDENFGVVGDGVVMNYAFAIDDSRVSLVVFNDVSRSIHFPG